MTLTAPGQQARAAQVSATDGKKIDGNLGALPVAPAHHAQ